MNFLERREVEPKVPSFREMLTKVTFAPNRNIDPTIQKIDLGSFADHAQELRDITKADHKHREAGRVFIFKNDEYPRAGQPRLIGTKIEIGTPDDCPYHIGEIRLGGDNEERRNLLRISRQDKFLATPLHSHPTDSPPSPRDVSSILADDIEVPNAGTCVFVAGTKTNHLMFRGPQTPSLSAEDKLLFEEKWERKKIEALTGKPYDKSLLKFGKMWLKSLLGGNFKKQYSELENAINHQILREMIKEYGLIAFSGSADSRTVNRVSA